MVETWDAVGLGSYSEPQKVGNMGLGGFVLGSPILQLKGMRILMFQLSGFYYRVQGIAFVGLRIYGGVILELCWV